MVHPSRQPGDPPTAAAATRVGCVSYLNAKPLIDGLEDDAAVRVAYDVPARLLDDLENGMADIALCPVIDYHRSTTPLKIIPVGGIGCNGSTLTVRLYSRVPIDEVTVVHADMDSHTSVALLQVLMQIIHRRRPKMIHYDAREHTADGKLVHAPEAMLLIGDKVVTDSPKAVEYPHQLDLGQAWRDATGRPFVFAVWMAKENALVDAAAKRLQLTRERNARRIDEIVARYASRHGWPQELAGRYLGEVLRYRIGPAELEAISHFSMWCERLGLIERMREIKTS